MLVEIVGFWTPDYLERKLRRLREARLSNLILCIDEALACREEDLIDHPHVVPFRRRIDAGAVLTRVEALLQSSPPARPRT